jgi:NhaP-type Na+/H+ or K+/H+ antiporter
MGIPYSKQINAAFDQVTPLVGEGFKVLETTKDIAVLLAWIEVLTVILLGLILAALFGLLITMNPDLETERRALVTPIMKTLYASRHLVLVSGFFVVLVAGALGYMYLLKKTFIQNVNDEEIDEAKKDIEESEEKVA